MAGIDEYTVLMLHMNGADESTTFTDSSFSAHGDGVATGNVQLDTTQKYFGSASGLFDGTGDYISYADSEDWDWGSNSFTVDCWVRFTSVSVPNVIIARSTSGSSYMYWQLQNGVSRFVDYASGYTIDFNVAPTLAINTWYHVAIARSGSNWRMFLNGVQIGSTYSNSNAMNDRSVDMDVGMMTENASYVMHGWIDELRISKGIARWTTDFSVPTEEYSAELSIDIAETVGISESWNIQTNPEQINIEETVGVSESWQILRNPDNIDIAETVGVSESWDISLVQRADYASSATYVDSYVYLVTNTSPAYIFKIDISTPTAISWTSYEISGLSYAKDIVYNSTNGYFYIACSSGQIKKVSKADLETQSTIDTSDSNNLILADSLDDYLRSFYATNDTDGEIIMVDEATIETLNTDIRWIKEITTKISTRIDTILGTLINTDIRFIAESTTQIKTDIRWLKYAYSDTSRYPIDYADIQVKINGTDLCPYNDVNMKSIQITHDINEESYRGSTATFVLNRRHDRLDYDNQGNSSQITNSNAVIIIINGHTEFTGKISDIETNSEEERVTISAIGTRPDDKRQTVNIPLASVGDDMHLYNCILHAPHIYNPYIDPNEEYPVVYKGLKVNLGTQIEQRILRFRSIEDVTSLAEKIEAGEFEAKQNWTYFWKASFENFVSGTEATNQRYLGTSLGSMSTDTWKINGASYYYQKELEDEETELGYYTLGSEPYDEVNAPEDGKKIVKDKWVDKVDGLYTERDAGYDYEQFVKDWADIEYQKRQNINGDILPVTSANIDLSLDAYYYYGIKLLTRINVTNTTTPNIYKDNKGFPVAVKTILISTAGGVNGFKVSLTCDNQKSQLEYDELDAEKPDKNSDEYVFAESSTKYNAKFDPNSWTYPE